MSGTRVIAASRVGTTVRAMLLFPLSPRVACAVGEPFFTLVGLRRVAGRRATMSPREVLVVRLDEIGDVVLTSPLLRELRRRLPDARITLLVTTTNYDLVKTCPYVDEVVAVDLPLGHVQSSGAHGRPDGWAAYRRLWQLQWLALHVGRRYLWRHRFDLAVFPRWDTDHYRGAFVAYASGATRRIGYAQDVTDLKRRVNHDYDRLFTDVLAGRALAHEVERNLDVVRFLGGVVRDTHLELWIGPDDAAYAQTCLNLQQVPPGVPLVALGIGAREPKRMWPLACFMELGARLLEEWQSCRLLVVGGKAEGDLGRSLQACLGDRVINVAGWTTLRQTAALLQRSSLYIGNDTGVMHLAAAAGTPVIELSCHPLTGSPQHHNAPARFGPWGVAHAVLQPTGPAFPCNDGCEATVAHCIRGVTVDHVMQAVDMLMPERAPSAVAQEVLARSRVG